MAGEPGSPAKVFRPPHKHLKWLVKSDHRSSCKTKLSYTPGGQSCKTIPKRWCEAMASPRLSLGFPKLSDQDGGGLKKTFSDDRCPLRVSKLGLRTAHAWPRPFRLHSRKAIFIIGFQMAWPRHSCSNVNLWNLLVVSGQGDRGIFSWTGPTCSRRSTRSSYLHFH